MRPDDHRRYVVTVDYEGGGSKREYGNKWGYVCAFAKQEFQEDSTTGVEVWDRDMRQLWVVRQMNGVLGLKRIG